LSKWQTSNLQSVYKIFDNLLSLISKPPNVYKIGEKRTEKYKTEWECLTDPSIEYIYTDIYGFKHLKNKIVAYD